MLDFWTTWCVACRADGPALDKLYAKYGGQNLEIIGISDSEDRAIVEKYLKEHPHAYPIVLTYENEMPRSFQIGVLPNVYRDREGWHGKRGSRRRPGLLRASEDAQEGGHGVRLSTQGCWNPIKVRLRLSSKQNLKSQRSAETFA